MTIDKTLPQSIEAEMAVLGSMVIEKEAIATVFDILTENDFYHESHRRIFLIIKNLYVENIPVDTVSVTDELKKQKALVDIGGAAYITELINTVSTAANIEHYAKIVREKAILRQLIKTGTQIAESGYRGTDEADLLLDNAEQSIFAIARVKAQSGFVEAKDLVHPAIEHIEALMTNKKSTTGVPVGYRKVDEMTGGFQPSNLIIVAGRPSMGKTSFCMNILSNLAIKSKVPVGMFSLEMSKEEIVLRLLCSEAHISSHLVRQGMTSKKAWPAITTAGQYIYESPIFIDDTPNLSMLDVRMRARRLAADLATKGKKLSIIIIDYIQLMRSAYRSESRQQEVAEISRSLKALARELDLPVIAVSQLSRKTEERGREGNRPMLSDLRESGALEQDADVVMFIYREEVYKPDREDLKNKATIIIAKQRNGPTGNVDLAFIKEWTRFEELAKE
ncbi:MAG: replicative DNA helicase [Elusimicrobia bacterium CG1_02_37_114]|nr:MAG: replicative DNA helicase [Elusimicrobia bacterium CG1_02_37_114]PIZ13623.1 MAG: replicative DNA helicase [Elusimicrobia bacterium CG_4_10_14_0_8_um_filter_37_32]